MVATGDVSFGTPKTNNTIILCRKYIFKWCMFHIFSIAMLVFEGANIGKIRSWK